MLALLGCGGPTTPTDTSGTPTPAAPPAEVELEVLSAPVCTDPSARHTARFRAYTMAEPTPPSQSYLWGAGIAAADFDGDGISEVIAVHETELEYLHWTGDAWVPRAGLPELGLVRGFGAAPVDIDADGDLDLVITQKGGVDHLLINDGTGRFLADTPPVIAGAADHHSASTTAADFDGDGDLDLLIAGHGHVDEDGGDPAHFQPADSTRLLRNDNGSWTDDSERIPLGAHDRYTFIGGAQDLDQDGDLDLLMVNDFGRLFGACQLLWNTPDGFVADDNAAGLDMNVAGMGLAWATLNDDEVPDLLMPFWAGYKVMLSAQGSWFDYTNPSGLRPAINEDQEVGWGANFGDLDNDGRIDAVVMHGWLSTGITPNVFDQPDALFRGTEGGFDNVTSEWGHIDEGDNRGLVVSDLDGDGWLDLARPSLNGPTVIYMANCGTEAWLEVELEQPGPNPHGIGAVVRVEGGDHTHTRYVLAGGEGYGSGGPPLAHVGLGTDAQVTLVVHWPDGITHRFEGLPTRQRVRVRRVR